MSLSDKEKQMLIEKIRSEFSSRGDLQDRNQKLYDGLKSHHRELLIEALHSKQDSYRTHTLESCKLEALKYKTRNEWYKKDCNSYIKASRNKWLEECCKHMTRMTGFLTLEECKKRAKKYKTKGEWYKKDCSSYSAAVKNKWLEECCKHMTRMTGFLTLEECKKRAKKYKTRNEWRKKDGGSYNAARKNKWFEECCKHMKPSASSKKKTQCIETGIIYESISEAARQMNLDISIIARVCTGKYKSTGGYTFKYIEE
jgi:aminopeptidase C